MIALPPWVDAELWSEYVAQRKKDKKEMSPRSEKERLARLDRIRAAGHDPNQSILDALNGHWLDFYEPRELELTVKRSSEAEKTAQMLAEQSTGWTPPPDNIRQMSRRRV